MDQENTARLLIVEDDPEVSTGLELYLENAGYALRLAATGEEGLELALAVPGYDLIVLDANLPGRDGFDVLREMRAQSVRTPVLMLTGRGTPEDKLRGFELGVDDYLTKPFNPDVLLARIAAILRRAGRVPDDAEAVYRVGGLEVDLASGKVSRDGKPIGLTELEFKLLRYLILHRGRTTTREQILREVWSLPSDIETRTIDRHINALRKVMDGDSEDEWAIQSVYGIGYKIRNVEKKP